MLIDFNNIAPMTIPGMNGGTGTMTAQLYNDDAYRISIRAGASASMYRRAETI